jgi:hypothetical protein
MRRFRRGRDDRGGVLIELAAVAPVMVALLMGFIDFSDVYNDQIVLRQGAREGARQLIEAQGSNHPLDCADTLTGDFADGTGIDQRLQRIACMVKDRAGLDPSEIRVAIRVDGTVGAASPYVAELSSVSVCISQQIRSKSGLYRFMLDDRNQLNRAKSEMRVLKVFEDTPPLVLADLSEDPPAASADWSWCTAEAYDPPVALGAFEEALP